jgi:hypothetical protein
MRTFISRVVIRTSDMASASNGYTELLALIGDESLEGIVFGKYYEYDRETRTRSDIVPRDKEDIVLSLEEAAPILKMFSFDHGYGIEKCPAITAWTKTKVIVVLIYDGSTMLVDIPRHATEHTPFYVGGG